MNFNFITFAWLLSVVWVGTPTHRARAQENPVQTPLIVAPRQAFTPTPQSVRGYWNIDVVGDFTLPKTKSITFCGAGRNLHVNQDWSKLFRRGFSSIERGRMTKDEIGFADTERISRENKPAKLLNGPSRLLPEQRALILYQNYFTSPPFNLPWANNSEFARTTHFLQPPGSATPRESMGFAMSELSGACVGFADCPSSGYVNTFGKIFFDLENEGTSPENQQEHANIYAYKVWALRKVVSPYTEIGGIGPVPHNSYGYSREMDFANTGSPDWLWATKARQIDATNTRGRGMPDDIVGKSFGDLVDFQMPGTYYLSSDFDNSAPHYGDGDRHWLASLLGEQEVNMKLSSKKSVAWQWLFNTQSTDPSQAARAEHPAPPAIAEGMAIFYWFTGAHGSIFWDDWVDLMPNAPVVSGREDLDNNRNYACYEHYIHGLWRLFKHNGDLFNGQEKYLNEQTECSYDNGRTWYRLNSNAQKQSRLPFARAIVNGGEILIAATQPYASPNQQGQLMVRYVQDGYRFYTTINLKGDEIYLGRAKMPTGNSAVTPSQTSITSVTPPAPGGQLLATVVSYNCTTGAIVFGATGGNGSPIDYAAIGVVGWTNDPSQTIGAGLRFDPKPITVLVRQGGVQGSSFVFDLKAYCAGGALPPTPVNTAPTVVNVVNGQAVTAGTAYSLNVGGVFTDAQTPTGLTLSATGLPAGLTLSGSLITGTPSVSGVSTVTLRATDSGGLSNTFSFVLTVNPVINTIPPSTTGMTPPTNTTTSPPSTTTSTTPAPGGPLAATVVSYNCTTGAIVFGSTGGNGSPIDYAAIGVVGWTSDPSQTIGDGLRFDPKPITILVRQGGRAGSSFLFDLKAYCAAGSLPPTPVNTAPTVVNVVNAQAATAGTAYSLNVGSVFTDAQTPTGLMLSATGLPTGLNLSGSLITGTPSVSGVSTVTLRATDPGGLSANFSFVLTVNPVISTTPPSTTTATPPSTTGTTPPSTTGTTPPSTTATTPPSTTATTPPSTTTVTPPNPPVMSSCGSPNSTIGQTLRVTGVSSINCQNGTFRVITTGGNGSAMNFDNLVGLNNADPTNCIRGLDNPDLISAINNPGSDVGNFHIRVIQGGVTSNTFTFNFKQYCTGSGRIASENRPDLDVQVLGNPTLSEWVDVNVTGVQDEALTFRLLDMLGSQVSNQKVEPSGNTVRQRVWLGNASGVFLLQINTPTRSKTVKVVRQ